MKRKVFFIGLMLMTVVFLGACGENQYEKDARSGFDKFSSGNFGSMTPGEKKAVNDFLEWSSKN